MIRHIKRYINHVKHQSQAIKEVHAVLFATLGTVVFIFLYLYVSSVSDSTDKEGEPITSTNFASPITLFLDQVKRATEEFGKGATFQVVNKNDGANGEGVSGEIAP